MLYPTMTESRMVFSLDGIWDFQLIEPGHVHHPSVPLSHGIAMPVPSSYNDIYEGRQFREHMGDMVYERTFAVHESMLSHKRLFLRFGSVTHRADIYINGISVISHKGGFLPFEMEINPYVLLGENRLTVLVSNIVDETTLPCGRFSRLQLPDGLPDKITNLPNFDFFNYCGIMRPVLLYTTPMAHILDITVTGDMDGNFRYEITADAYDSLTAEVLDGAAVLWRGNGTQGCGHLPSVARWSCKTPALYQLHVTMKHGDCIDTYTEFFGFRTIEIKNCGIYLNGSSIYLKGFGRHEDSPVLGRGFSNVYNAKDMALMKWMGANSFRTSHYPYSEEMMRLCDREGMMVINELPAVGLHTGFTATGLLGNAANGTWQKVKTQEHHRDVLRDLISRDKNHPCVIMWSIANEPASEEEGANEYFQPLMEFAKATDPQSRPVTIVTYGGATPETCKVAHLCDVLMINRYNGWYETEGDMSSSMILLAHELERFHKKYPQKPIIFGEFGADTIAGFHDTTASLFSEEFQQEFIQAFCQLFDTKAYVRGEHVWNFADFATAENIKRVQGNKKGIFTRDRKPKMAAWYLKNRWTSV